MSALRRVACLLLPLVAAAADGADSPWKLLGPFDQGAGAPVPMQSVVAVPNSTTLYASGAGGIFRSDDAGAHWADLGNPGGEGVYPIRLDPSNPATLYAGTTAGLFKTSDGGATWAASGLADSAVYSVAVDPLSPNVLYAGTAPIQGTVWGRIYKSQDGGASWSALDVFPYGAVLSLAVDPLAPSTLFVGSAYGTLLRSRDGGDHWDAGDLLLGAVNQIVVDPSAPGLVYAQWSANSYAEGTRPAGSLRCSADGGTTWADVPGLPTHDAGPFVLDPGSPQTGYFVSSGSLYRTIDHGQSWGVIGPAVRSTELAVPTGGAPLLYAAGDGILEYDLSILPPTCDASPTALCLQFGRFSARVDWKQSPLGPSLQAQAVPVTNDSGYFWFFGPENVELMVKVLDGTGINGDFWVFYGALSNVAYTLTVTDTLTGATRVYDNPQGTLASVADTRAFPGAVSLAPELAPPAALLLASPKTVCIPDPAALCLEQGRFQVRVAWQRTPLGPSFSAAAVPLTGDTGYFWFFDDLNVELVVKVLDGTAVNGHYWVFYGALSDVQYTITVTDSLTGEERTYENPQGTLASVADTAAF